MELEKIRNLSDDELKQQETTGRRATVPPALPDDAGPDRRREEAAELKKDIARIKTIARERELGDPRGRSTKAADPSESGEAARRAREEDPRRRRARRRSEAGTKQ